MVRTACRRRGSVEGLNTSCPKVKCWERRKSMCSLERLGVWGKRNFRLLSWRALKRCSVREEMSFPLAVSSSSFWW